MTTISAEMILSSRAAATGDVLSTLRLRYPRFIHAEFMTHRVLSRNASSSRAVPIERLIQDVVDDPAVPIYWGSNKPGMQAGEECANLLRLRSYLDERIIYNYSREEGWLRARDSAVVAARAFSEAGYHKQIANRLLEPFAHINVIVSATEWDNFMELRDHPDAEPHIRDLAREIRKELDKPVMQTLEPGEWHTPWALTGLIEERKVLSAARCASVSYETVDGKELTLERAQRIMSKLMGPPLHASPFEHVARASGDEGTGLWGNFSGWDQLRKILEEGK